jgi:hypothetical protein
MSARVVVFGSEIAHRVTCMALNGVSNGTSTCQTVPVAVGRGKGDDVSDSNATARASFTVPRLGTGESRIST